MTSQSITWATKHDAFSITLLLNHQKPAVVFADTGELYIKNVGLKSSCLVEVFSYEPTFPRILIRGSADYTKPDPDGKSDMRGAFYFIGYAEVSGADVVPDTITGTVNYIRDIENGLINSNAEAPMAFRRKP